MNIIITAGGTRERIDSVRTITNEATGRMGSLIAEEFSRRLSGKEHKIYYLCGIGAMIPEVKDDSIQIIRIEGTEQLLDEIKRLLTTQNIFAVVHSMAVSDYRVSSFMTLEHAAEAMYQKLHMKRESEAVEEGQKESYEEWQQAMLEAMQEQPEESFGGVTSAKQHKLSSSMEHPLLLLEKTPKVIGFIKKLSPKTRLVGFKLLSGVDREELIDTAFQLLQKNQCDYVLANDTTEINGESHVGYLVDKAGNYQTFLSKTEIAKGIAEGILLS